MVVEPKAFQYSPAACARQAFRLAACAKLVNDLTVTNSAASLDGVELNMAELNMAYGQRTQRISWRYMCRDVAL